MNNNVVSINKFQKEKDILFDVLNMWISSEDKGSELYNFIREDMDEEEHQLFNPKDHQLFIDWLVKEYEVDVDSYEKFYQIDKTKYEEYIDTKKEREEMWAKIGNNIKSERLEAGLSLEQLAEKTWYHSDDIAYLERGGEYDKRMVLSLQNAMRVHKMSSFYESTQIVLN